ncbi:MFS transporter [Bradyrhizobium macuxiense]|uniref:MFS transporter n=2 Tax=Bradyrhizobium macuxiense TaxID=1755647 RepID=A0A109JGP6_9BRAD|nr:MFS transporter [Bradyrhizobium macuxiense]
MTTVAATAVEGRTASSRGSIEEIAGRMERLPMCGYLWRLIILISLGGFFELYDLFFTGYIAPGMTQSGLLSTTTANFFGFQGIGAFVAVTFIGLFIGTFFLGFIPDKLGRRFVFTWALVIYTIATVIMAFQTSTEWLLAWRLFAGIGLGVEAITIDAYITELVPRRMRGRAFALNQTIMFLAQPTVALMAWWLVPQSPLGFDGWRWVICIAAFGAVIVWFVRRAVPESPFWLSQKGRTAEADNILSTIEVRVERQIGTKLEVATPMFIPRSSTTAALPDLGRTPYLTIVLTLVVFNLCQAFGYYGFSSWAPTLLIEKGITITKSLQYSFVIAFAAPLAPLVAISYADKVERKWIIVTMAFVIACAGYGFAEFVQPVAIVACGLAITFANTTLSFAYHAYQTEVFPARIRAQAAGIVYSASRVGAMFSGFAVAFVLRNSGVSGVFAAITTAMMIVMLVISIFGPKTREQVAA